MTKEEILKSRKIKTLLNGEVLVPTSFNPSIDDYIKIMDRVKESGAKNYSDYIRKMLLYAEFPKEAFKYK